MTEQKFKSEMRRAEIMRQESDPDRAEYWVGYIRGLRRAYHGDKFGTEDEHKAWFNALNGDHEYQKQRGRGYRDGLDFKRISSRMGRPSISNEQTVAITLRVPVSVRDRIPEPRGEWVRNLIINNVPK